MNENNPLRTFLNPIVAIAGCILIGVLFLLMCAILGWDKGVLAGMSKIEYARGLITYLFAVVTIGTAVLLVVSVLIGKDDQHSEKQFQRGKEILSLLLGVFGTIVGFYFGSEISKGNQPLKIAPVHLSSTVLSSGAKFSLETFVSGGRAPYLYSIGVDTEPSEPNMATEETGWITRDLTAPAVTEEKVITVAIRVRDANGEIVQQSASVTVKPPG